LIVGESEHWEAAYLQASLFLGYCSSPYQKTQMPQLSVKNFKHSSNN